MTAATIHRHATLVAGAVLTAAQLAPAGDPARTLRALILPYGGAVGRTSAGEVTAAPGALTWAADLRRVKLLSGHDREQPVGYLAALTEDSAGLWADLVFAATPAGDAALTEATEGARDAVSVELEDVELDDQNTIVAAELVAVALVSLPAFSDARIAARLAVTAARAAAEPPAGTAPPAGTTPADDDTDDTDEADDDDDDDTDDTDDTDPVVQVDTYLTPIPEGTPVTTTTVQAAATPAALAAARTRARRMDLTATAALIAERFRNSDRSAAALNAALADVTPVSTGYAAVAPYQWVGEVWTPVYTALDWVNSVTKAPLTNMTVTGWRRTTGPKIQPYAGNKAPIPTDATLGFEPVTVPAVRHAVGADFDRVWIDFSDESVIQSWLTMVAQDYAEKIDTALGALIVAESADNPAGAAADVIGAIRLAAQQLKRGGAVVSYIALAADLFAAYLDIPTSEAPWWLTGSSSVSLSGATASVNDLRVFESLDVPDGTVVAGDRRAVTHYEPRGNPFTVRAVDLAKGGLDVGVFGYSADLVNSFAGITQATVTVIP